MKFNDFFLHEKDIYGVEHFKHNKNKNNEDKQGEKIDMKICNFLSTLFKKSPTTCTLLHENKYGSI